MEGARLGDQAPPHGPFCSFERHPGALEHALGVFERQPGTWVSDEPRFLGDAGVFAAGNTPTFAFVGVFVRQRFAKVDDECAKVAENIATIAPIGVLVAFEYAKIAKPYAKCANDDPIIEKDFAKVSDEHAIIEKDFAKVGDEHANRGCELANARDGPR